MSYQYDPLVFNSLVPASSSGANVNNPTAVVAAGGGIPYKPQLVTTRCGINIGITNNNSSGGSAGWDIRIESRIKMYVGPQSITQIQIGFMGWYYPATQGEAAIGNDYNAEAAIETLAGAFEEVTWPNNIVSGSSNFTTVGNNSTLVLSNPANVTPIAAGSSCWLRQGVFVPSSTYFLPENGSISITTGDAGVVSPSSQSQIPTSGALSTPSGGQGSFPPGVLVLGVPSAPHPSVMYFGDSIAYGANDTTAPDSLGSSGYIQRGLEAVGPNSYPLPNFKYAFPGQELLQYSLASIPRGMNLVQYMTHIIMQLGTNDIAVAGQTAAQLEANITSFCTWAKSIIGPYGKPPKIYVVKLLPRTTSTNSWATAANQTPVAGFTIGGARDQYNTWLSTQVGLGLIDGVIDPNTVCEDQVNHGVWVTNGTANYPTTDGIHPTSALDILAAAVVSTSAATFTP